MERPQWAFWDGRIVPYGEVRLGLLTHALNYGTGVFGGIRAYWNPDDAQLRVFRLADHVRRLRESATLLRMNVAQDEGAVAQGIVALLRQEGFKRDCYVRALAFYTDEVIGVRLHGLTPALGAVAVPFGLYIERVDGAHVTFSSWRRVDDNVIPPRGKITGGYVNSALLKSDAELAGFDEALVLGRDGFVSEGSGENVFIVRRGTVVTPSLTSGILEGITRRSVIALLREELGLCVEERPVDRTEVYLAEEVFLTGTAAQVTAVTRADHRAIGSGGLGPVTQRVRDLFRRAVLGTLPGREQWCTPIYPQTQA
jgi:branched-chain amino acid aminotransferase